MGRRGAKESLKQLVQLGNETIEVGQRRVHRTWGFHVDAGVAEEVERPLGAAAFEEGQIGVEFAVGAVEDALAEGDGGAQAGGVLVDVEGAVEVGDAQALK